MFKSFQQKVEWMWWQRKLPPLFLRLFSPIYAILAQHDQKSRLKRAVNPSIPMISVGNITVGGSGKTPFVVWLAEELKHLGFCPVLLSRGDGANNQTPHVVSQYSTAREIGDEAVLLFRLSGCPVIAGRDRMLAAQMAKELGDVLILDDGFQYRQLKRACDVVLIPSYGVGNGCLLPAGPLREPIAALHRADIVVRSGEAKASPLSAQHEWSWYTKNQIIRDWNSHETSFLYAKQAVYVLASIAKPQRFIQSLQALGCDIQGTDIFPDHHMYTAKDISHLQGCTVVTTGKDAVKLLPLWDHGKPLWVLEQQAIAQEGLLEAILQKTELS